MQPSQQFQPNQTLDTCTPSAAQNPAIKGEVPDSMNGGCFTNCDSQSVVHTATPTPAGTATTSHTKCPKNLARKTVRKPVSNAPMKKNAS